MHAYLVDRFDGQPPVFAADIPAVKRVVAVIPRDYRHDVRIRLVDIDVTKRAVINYLNGACPDRTTALRSWRIGGARGGKLIEIEVGDD